MYLTISLLYEKNLKFYLKLVLFCRLIDNISATQHKLQYYLVLQCKIMQHNTGGTVRYNTDGQHRF